MRLRLLRVLTSLTAIAHFASVTGSAALESNASSWAGVSTVSETGIGATRFLTTKGVGGGDDEGEERAGPTAPIVEKVQTLVTASNTAPEKLQKLLNVEKSADDAFTLLNLDKVGDSLFSIKNHEKLTQWLSSVDDLSAKRPAVGTSAISTLLAHYDDATLYSLFAKRIPRTKDVATKLQTEQMQLWLTAAKDPDDAFRLMKIGEAKGNILTNREFDVWAKYVGDFNAKYPDQAVSLAPTLVKLYKDGGLLFEMAQTAKNLKNTKNIAAKVQEELIRVWLNTGKTPDDVLVSIGLGKNSLLWENNAKIWENPLVNSWARYIKAYNIKNGEAEKAVRATMVEALTRTFGDDVVAKMILRAKANTATQSVASRLESAQLEMWRSSGKSVDDVYKLLRLDPEHLVGDIAVHPVFRVWVLYVNTVIAANPSKASTLLSTFESRFKDRPFNQILQLIVKKSSSLEKTAIAIQTEKIRGYLDSNQSPQKVFKMLVLDNTGDNLLGDPMFQLWMKYVKDFNKKNRKHQESLFTPLRMYYNPGPVNRMIEIAMENPSTVKIAKLVQRERSKYWLDEGQLPQLVFHFLDLSKTGEKTLASPNFKLWAKYLNDFNQRYPTQRETTLDGLRANYKDILLLPILAAAKKDPATEKMAANLQSALINKWLATGEKVDDLKRMLRGVPTSDEMITRYTAKLEVLSKSTSV